MKKLFILLMMLSIMALLNFGCTQASETDELTISRDRAIIISATNVPYSVIGESYVVTVLSEDKWIVHFVLSGNTTVTRNELEWPDAPDTKFENIGVLPADTFSLLTFQIDRKTGVILSRGASDTMLLGGPGIFNTEPPAEASLPLWSIIAVGIGGLFIGGIIVWLIMHLIMWRHLQLKA